MHAATYSLSELNGLVVAVEASDCPAIHRAFLGLSDTTGVRCDAPMRSVRNATVAEIDEIGCAAGFWCTAGVTVACLRGQFNPHRNQNNATACQACPPHSTTLDEGSTSATQCRCEPGHFELAVDARGMPVCERCPAGVNCDSSGVTLDRLPLLPGYFRPSEFSVDVRRCHDSHRTVCLTDTAANASVGASEGPPAALCVSASASGCAGGDAFEHMCLDGLTGPFCLVCAKAGHFLPPATSRSSPPRCDPCSERRSYDIGAAMAVAIAWALGLLVLPYVGQTAPPSHRVSGGDEDSHPLQALTGFRRRHPGMVLFFKRTRRWVRRLHLLEKSKIISPQLSRSNQRRLRQGPRICPL